MVWEFIKDLFKGFCRSYNGIGIWLGALSTIFFWLLPTFDLGGKMNATIAIISLPYRLLILLGFIFISVILTSYSMYKKQQEEIEKQQKEIADLQTNQKYIHGIDTKNTKQDIRTLLESISPEILQKIDKGQKEIHILFNIPTGIKLSDLSKRPDFDKFLSFKQTCDFGPSYKKDYINDWNDHTCKDDYYIYPKDALIK